MALNPRGTIATQYCKNGLETAVPLERTRRLHAKMRPLFNWYNAKVERDGLLLAQYRQF